ncbi:DNA polymerase III subunit delta [Desulfovibrio sp. OttesenSCG-928-C14]|nr:DNA polymerase III subunit delta [Desulfovibrio sp. OttesenSCG-928-C14]
MSRPGYSILAGPDPALLMEAAEDLARRHAPPQGQTRERHVFWADDLGPPFWEKLTLQGLFARPRIVVLRQAQLLPQDTLKKLSGALGGAAGDIWPFICFEYPYEKGKPKIPVQVARLKCFDFAAKQGWLQNVPPLDAKTLPLFIKKEAARLGLALNPDEIRLLTAALPPDAAAVRSEMEKLALTSAQGRLAPDALEEISYSREIDVFALIRELQGGKNPEKVWKQYFKEQIGQSDAGLFAFIAMLLREGRLMWQLLAGEPVFLPDQVRREKADLAGKMGFGGLARLWDLALHADKGVKTGERSPEQAREKLLSDLFLLFRKNQP